jgi:cytochrome c biogenesis protein CcmG/thiol:disulfide interchange protein DsbE
MKYFTPFFALFILLGLLGWELFYAKPGELPSALVGEPVPNFTLPNIFPAQPALQSTDLNGRVILLNVWATWCQSCKNEHPMLMKIKNEYHVPLFGISYKDNADDAIAWLKQNGNPFVLNGNDGNGDVAIELGVYGTPETFVIKEGRIIYRHVGMIDEQTWNEKLYPLIQQNEVRNGIE